MIYYVLKNTTRISTGEIRIRYRGQYTIDTENIEHAAFYQELKFADDDAGLALSSTGRQLTFTPHEVSENEAIPIIGKRRLEGQEPFADHRSGRRQTRAEMLAKAKNNSLHSR